MIQQESPDMERFKIVLADDHAAVRQIVRGILAEDSEMELIGEVEDGEALLKFLGDCPSLPDMVIVDISMPKLHGIEAARLIKRLYPDVKVLMLTVHREREYFYQAALAGAEGYLLKEDANTDLFAAIRSIRVGKTFKSALLNNSVH